MKAIRLTSNQSRVLYDGAVFLAAALLTALFTGLYGQPVSAAIVLAVPFALAANYAVGVNTRFRLGTPAVKTAILTCSTISTCCFLYLMLGDARASALWGAIAWGPLVVPRIFLNLYHKDKLGTIGRTMYQAIQQRGPVLVVGGGGYIGTHVIAQLLAEGYPVRVLDRMLYGKEPIREFLDNPNFQLIEGDVTDIGKLVEAVNGGWAVLHLAGLVGDPACAVDPSFTRHCNIIATRMLRDVSQSFGVQRFIFASSCSVYGVSDELVNESSGLNPVSLYAQTKIESERELLETFKDDFFVTVLRFATVFGHSRRPRFDLVANLFTAQAYCEGSISVHGGTQVRPFIHVFDLARAIVMVLKSDPYKVAGQVYNVGDEALNSTIAELAQTVHRVVSESREVALDIQTNVTDQRNYRVSFEKIRRSLGFRASVSIEQGVREMLAEFERKSYQDYHADVYSNLQVTKNSLGSFQDPMQASRLYTSLAA